MPAQGKASIVVGTQEEVPMKGRLWLAVPILLSAFALAKTKDLPAFFKNARFVRVEAYNGDALNPNVVPQDRRAIFDVEQQLKDWKRYGVVYEREHADLVFVVRKGRLASATGRADVDISRQPRQRGASQPFPDDGSASTGIGVGASAEAGPVDDLLEVYIVAPSGELNGPIWTHTLSNGLDAPKVPLFQQLRQAVDTAYP
jgi:hypothetical protein